MKLLSLTTCLCALLPLAASADLVGWWEFEGDFSDSSPNELESSEIGQPEFITGAPPAIGGKVLELLDGDADGVTVIEDDGLLVDTFTLGYFINQNGATQGNAGLERLTSRGGDSFETAIGDANALGGTSSETGTTLSYFQGGWNVTDVEIPDTGWVHVAWHNKGGESDDMELYINGTLEFTGPGVESGRLTGLLNIGIRHNEVEGFEGLIDDVFFWDNTTGALEPADIAKIAAVGLSNYLTDASTDEDGDGLPDAWETENGLDPSDDGSTDVANGPNGDPDGDTLTNSVELEDGTDPQDADSDDDTLTDAVEKTLGTNPNKEDSDGDGLPDGSEGPMGTDPTKPDTDGDGFTDSFEIENGSSPTDAASTPDSESTLVVYLDFDGDPTDKSGNENSGELLGDAEFVDDVPSVLGGGQSIRFNEGDVDGVSIPASESLNADVFTLAYFINQDGAEQGNVGLERLTSRTGDRFETAIGDASAIGGSEPNSLSYYSPGTGWTNTEVTVPESEWVHVAWRNGDEIELFIDGELAYTGAAVENLSGNLNIGTRHNEVEGYEGLMDEFRLYAKALSDDEILALATSPAGGATSFEITDITRNSETGAATITWNSLPGRIYAIDFSTDLQAWSEIDDSIPSGGSETSFTDAFVGPERSEGYYRIVIN